MNHLNGVLAERECVPGQLMRMVAGELIAHGFEVRSPEYDDERRLTITNLKDMRCWLIIEDCGYVECECVPQPSHDNDPTMLIGMVKNVLASDSEKRYHVAERPRMRNLSLKGIVGHELKAAGLDVGLDVYEDLDSYEVTAEIVVTNPGKPERGEIRISDEGAVTWECDPGEGGTDAGEITETAVSIITHEVSGISDATGGPQQAV
jgi:hypothetical protein